MLLATCNITARQNTITRFPGPQLLGLTHRQRAGNAIAMIQFPTGDGRVCCQSQSIWCTIWSL